MLKKRIVSDLDVRLRYACLAIVDGFLVPTSHYPKIVKDHAEMSEDLEGFLAYPWGRMSFEMMMTSIKEREVEQLATTCVTVQGLLYALQLVVLQAAPAIQEGPLMDEVVATDSDEDETVEVAPRQLVPLKLGNEKDLDAKCSTYVEPIICPDVEMNPEEDLTWSDDDEDVRVDNIVMLVGEGITFRNKMFIGGCIQSQVLVGPKKVKRGGKSKIVRGRKSKNQGRNPGGLRRKHQSPNLEKGQGCGYVGKEDLSRLLDDKLEGVEKRIIQGVINWFVKNTVIDVDNSKTRATSGHSVPADNQNQPFVGKNGNGFPPHASAAQAMYDSFPTGEYNIRSSTRVDVMDGVEDVLSFYKYKNVDGDGNNVSGVPGNQDNEMNVNDKTMPPSESSADKDKVPMPDVSSTLLDSSLQGEYQETSSPKESKSGSETTRKSLGDCWHPSSGWFC